MTELTDFTKSMSDHHIPTWDELPDLELYMDQVIVYLERQLSMYATKDDEKIITPAMINNYVKLGLIPPPNKKKYGKEHLAYLIAISILKPVLPIPHISQLIHYHQKHMELSTLLDIFGNQQCTSLSKCAEHLNNGLRSDEDPVLLALELTSLSCSYRLAAERILGEIPAEESKPEDPPKEKGKEPSKSKENENDEKK